MPSFKEALTSTLTSSARAANRWSMAFDVTDPAAVAWAAEHAAELVTAVTEDARAAIRVVVTLGFENEMPVPAIAKSVRATIGLTERDAQAVMNRQLKLLSQGTDTIKASAAAERYAVQLRNSRALMIARTETMAAANEGQLQMWHQAQDAGRLSQSAQKVWITADACPRCAPLEGETVPLDAEFSVGQDPPLHPRCLLGDCFVLSSSEITGASKRRFDGDAIIIRASEGRELTCTPSHPILTLRGWVAAGVLNVGDDIVCDGRSQWRDVVGRNHQDMPARIENVANSALCQSEMFAAYPVPTSAEDFHGDGFGSKVAIIGAKCFLWNSSDASFNEPTAQRQFVGRHLTNMFDSESAVALLSISDSTTSHLCVSCSNLFTPFVSGHLAPSHGFSFGLSSYRDSERDQFSLDGVAGSAELARQLKNGNAGEVFFDKVSFVSRHPFSGHVYNLETVSGWYAAGGIITQNCRCTVGLLP